ncbi:uncharacterized protein BDW43DRAFT_274349 [Aspergillus alliaceus]|uniref:uncharacterized protein n=1 Tax=Petromyces alliaceus TaxID=209559 RepID=UPI0012A53E85|nr:uncharacterized protein BDW43DRAFT_274349 [Aspergillus alliaceus]KAB8234130.1 hypothetical protein BDW43DRAFT_274349 [Aspergillus alliaceus]
MEMRQPEFIEIIHTRYAHTFGDSSHACLRGVHAEEFSAIVKAEAWRFTSSNSQD